MKRITACSLLFALIFLFAACFSSEKGGEGIITISLGSRNSRAILWPTEDPAVIMQLDYEIFLSGNGEIKYLTAKGTDTVTAIVAAGYWNVKLDAYIENGSVHYASGSAFVDVIAGQNNTVSVPMTKAFDAIWIDERTGITVEIWEKEDGNIIVSPEFVTIYKIGPPEKSYFTATVNNSGDYENIRWWLWGYDITESNNEETISINAADYNVGTYRLMVMVYKNDIPYSIEIIFTVEEKE